MANLKYICPVCGGEVTFDIESQKMVCKYCDNSFTVEELSAKDEKLDTADKTEASANQWTQSEIEGMRVYHCAHCGAMVDGEETLGAFTCPYCDTPMVISDNMGGGRKPDYIIPFKIKKDMATVKLKEFCNGKKLLPASFLANHRVESLKGMYVPFWLFSCNTNSTYTYEGTTVSSRTEGNYRVTETKYYNVVRNGSVDFQNVPVDGSEKMDDTYMQSIEPFDYTGLEDFKSAYLAGYIADRYDVDDEAATKYADDRIKKTLDNEFKKAASLGYSSVTLKNKDVRVNYDGHAKYAMLPVWMMTTIYEGKPYQYILNGQTGKFVGTLPIDVKKKKKIFWKTTAITTIVGVVLGFISLVIF